MKKTVSILLVIAMCLTLFAGCGGSPAKKDSNSVQTNENAGGEIVDSKGAAGSAGETGTKSDESGGQTVGGHVENLIIGTTAENNVFSALSQKDAFGRMNYNGLTQGNFVYQDANNELQPYFWKSFTISDDGKQIDFTMPTDAVWHDGQPVTMDDMVFTFEYMRDVRKVGSLKNLTEVKVTGEDSASLIFSEPDGY